MAYADIVDLNQLVFRYAAAVDAADDAAVLDLFHVDATMRTYQGDSAEPFGVMVGHEQLGKMGSTTREMFGVTFHQMMNHLVEVDGDTATGSVLCNARHLSRDPADPAAFVNVIKYVDRYERRDGTWRISERDIRFFWTERYGTAAGI